MASGCPVIAYRAGGALETVVEEGDEEGRAPTGLFFDWQEEEAVIEAVRRFRPERFDPEALRRHAARFDRSVFKGNIEALLRDEEELLDS
jgi:glycosyltransferase involved in cell wall biosynthesis